MEMFDMTHIQADMVDLMIEIINAEVEEGEEIVLRTPFGVQFWKVVHLDNQSTIGFYEAEIVFETPNGVLEINGYSYKFDNEYYATIIIDGHEIDEEKFMWYDLS